MYLNMLNSCYFQDALTDNLQLLLEDESIMESQSWFDVYAFSLFYE